VELGQAFERMRAKATIIQGPDCILPKEDKEDPEVSATIASMLQSEGIDIVMGARFIKASCNGDKKVVTTEQGNQLLSFEADEIILALGRKPNVEGLNLEAAGVEYDSKHARNALFYGITAMPGDHFLSLSMAGVLERYGNR
jgi:pyruvate/2-oxoglutarate dehydrogenase complex dihydrolipoamide dehydrogenase (E3) component